MVPTGLDSQSSYGCPLQIGFLLRFPSLPSFKMRSRSGPRVLQVAVTDLSPAGPIQAVEIQVESSSLANMCRAHHAIIRRMQVLQPAGAMGTAASGVGAGEQALQAGQVP